MSHRGLLGALVLTFAMGCGSGTDGAEPSAPTSLYAGMYTTTTDVSAELATVRGVEQVVDLTEADQWDSVEARVAGTTAVGRLLARLDQEFIAAPATSEFGIERTLRRGIALGRAARTDAERDVAHEVVVKSFMVVLGLAMQSELRAVADDAGAARWASARQRWDRAAVYFSGLEPGVREYQTQRIPGVWGAGHDALSSDDFAASMIELLGRGRAAIAASTGRATIETATQAGVYVTRLYFLAAVKYATLLDNATRASVTPDPAWQTEGTYAYEGVVASFFGRAPTAAASTARARWRGPAAMITRAQLLRDSAELYADVNARALEGYASATDSERWSAIVRATATVDVLAEALTASGQSPATLKGELVMARALSETGNHADAIARLREVQTAVERVGVGL